MKPTLARVADLAEQVRGVSYGKEDASATERPGYLPVLRAGNITDEGLTFDDLVFVPAERISPKQRVRKNDVVIAASSGSLDVVGKAARALADFEGGFGAFCKVLRPGPLVDPAYFAHFFKTRDYRRRVSALAAGININNLRNEHLDEMKIPLPPVPEQRRIGEVLDRAEALRARRRAALAQLDTLTQAMFLDVFGDPATNLKGWPVCRVSEYVAEFQGGKSIEAEVGEGVTTRNRVLKVSAVTGMKYLPEQSKPVPDSYEPPEEHFVRPGDLLFSRANTTELVGAVAYVDRTPPHLLLPDKLWRFVWRDPAAVEPLFVWALFQTVTMRYEIGRRATGTSGSMKNISQEKVLGIRTIFPPVEEQRDFARLVTKAEKLKATQEISVTELEALFTSLQHRGFRGGVVAVRGEFIGVWAETWREIWTPLFDQESVPEDVFCELYRELAPSLRARPTVEALADIIDSPVQSREAFEATRAEAFAGERGLVTFLEAAHAALDDLGGDPLSNVYFNLLSGFIDKYSLRYDLRRPCTLCPTLPGLFASLVRDLRAVTTKDAHLDALMKDFENAVRDLRTDCSDGRIKTCIQKQVNLLEAIGRMFPGVTGTTLGVICDQVGTWPHDKLKMAMKDLYSFASDYPGIRHGGTPANAIRAIEMRDLIVMSILLAGFTPYLSDQLNADVVYRGN